MKNFWKIVLFSFVVFFLSWVVVYKTGINTLPIQSEDTVPTMFLPLAIIRDKTLYLDNYYATMLNRYPHPDDKQYLKGMTPFYLRRIEIEKELLTDLNPTFLRTRMVSEYRYLSAFPLITGILALPVYLIPVALGMAATWNNLILLSHITSAAIMAFSTGFFYLLLKRHFTKKEGDAILLSGIYAFCTVNYAMLSQSLWQHGTVQLFAILGTLFMFEALDKKKDYYFYFSGFMFGFAILARPTALLMVFFISLLILIKWFDQKRKNLLSLLQNSAYFVLGFIPPILFFILYNNVYYKDIANQGYSSQLLVGWLGRFPEGFLGTWFSPSKGILVYSPVIIFSLIGFWLHMNKKTWKKEFHYLLFGVIVLLHTLVMSKWKHWYGGYSFGYRMSSDIIPFLVLLMVPYLNSNLFKKTKKLFYLCIVGSFLVQIFGLVFFDGIWHNAYDKGFTNTSWLWSIKDSELFFNARRVLVKLNLLSKACPQCLPR